VNDSLFLIYVSRKYNNNDGDDNNCDDEDNDDDVDYESITFVVLQCQCFQSILEPID